jgi:hypothetical protein
VSPLRRTLETLAIAMDDRMQSLLVVALPLLTEAPAGGEALCNCPSPPAELERDFPGVDFSLLRRELELHALARASDSEELGNVTAGCPNLRIGGMAEPEARSRGAASAVNTAPSQRHTLPATPVSSRGPESRGSLGVHGQRLPRSAWQTTVESLQRSSTAPVLPVDFVQQESQQQMSLRANATLALLAARPESVVGVMMHGWSLKHLLNAEAGAREQEFGQYPAFADAGVYHLHRDTHKLTLLEEWTSPLRTHASHHAAPVLFAADGEVDTPLGGTP